jgi:hypothetical protein
MRERGRLRRLSRLFLASKMLETFSELQFYSDWDFGP